MFCRVVVEVLVVPEVVALVGQAAHQLPDVATLHQDLSGMTSRSFCKQTSGSWSQVSAAAIHSGK